MAREGTVKAYFRGNGANVMKNIPETVSCTALCRIYLAGSLGKCMSCPNKVKSIMNTFTHVWLYLPESFGFLWHVSASEDFLYLPCLQALKLTLNDRIKDKICNGGHALTLGRAYQSRALCHRPTSPQSCLSARPHQCRL